MTRLQEGDPAPDFTLPSPDGPRTLSALRGQWVVLYFYPKDFTPGCTQEACDFRDAVAADLGAAVLGVSADGVEDHARFAEAHGLGFPLLSDADGAVAARYGAADAASADGTRPEVRRSTFVIDPRGTVRRAYLGVSSKGHAARVVEELTDLQRSAEETPR